MPLSLFSQGGLAKRVRRLLLTTLMLVCGVLMSAAAQAAALQYFIDYNYENVATLNRVKQQEFDIGMDWYNPKMKFTGYAAKPFFNNGRGVYGTAYSNEHNLVPFGEIDYRLNKKIVLGVSVTEPYYANVVWGNSSFLRFTSTKSRVYSVRITPMISYQLTPRLAVGFGIYYQSMFNYSLNFATPMTGNIKNKTEAGDFVGYTLGIFYVINPRTYLTAAAWTDKTFLMRGTSKSSRGGPNGAPLESNRYNIDAFDPTVVYVGLIRQMTPNWLIAGKVYYSHWSSVKFFRLNNTVLGNLVFTNKWHDTWSFEFFTKYDINKSFSAFFGAMYETNFTRATFNTAGYPGSDALGLGAGFMTHIYQHWSGQFTYMHYMFVPKATINNAFDTGRAGLNADVIGLKLTYAV